MMFSICSSQPRLGRRGQGWAGIVAGLRRQCDHFKVIDGEGAGVTFLQLSPQGPGGRG